MDHASLILISQTCPELIGSPQGPMVPRWVDIFLLTLLLGKGDMIANDFYDECMQSVIPPQMA